MREYPGKDRSADGMVRAAYRAGHNAKDRFRVRSHILGICKERRCEHGRHARVLHTDLDGDRALFRGIKLEKSAHAIAQHIAERIMAEHYREHEEKESNPVGKQLRAHRHHDTAHDAHKADNAHRRHVRLDFLENGTLAQKVIAQEPDGDWRDSHVQDVQEHSLRVHVDTRVGKPQHKQRSHNGRKQS